MMTMSTSKKSPLARSDFGLRPTQGQSRFLKALIAILWRIGGVTRLRPSNLNKISFQYK